MLGLPSTSGTAKAQISRSSSEAHLRHARIPGLDGIRAIAVLMVLLAHSDLTREYTGGTGVSIFFFLSGYLITTLLLREQAATGTISLRNFYIRRFFRIFPPLYLLIATGCLFSATAVTGGQLSIRGISSAALFGGNYFMLNLHHSWPDGFGILWSLAVEEHFYLVFPILFIAIRNWPRLRQIALLMGLCGLVLTWRFVLLAHNQQSRLYLATDTRFDGILFGCILALFLDPSKQPSRPLPNRLHKFFAVAGALGTLLWEHIPYIKGPLAFTLTSLSIMPVFSYLLASPSCRFVLWLESRFLVRVGILSYSIYLFHVLCISIFARHTNLVPPVRMLLALPLCYAIALFIERFVDRPSNRLRQRYLHRPGGKQANVPGLPQLTV